MLDVLFRNEPKLREHLSKDVIPITPFLVAKARLANDKRLKLALECIVDAKLVPNTSAWCKARGTEAPILVDEPVDGRRLLRDDELTPEPA